MLEQEGQGGRKKPGGWRAVSERRARRAQEGRARALMWTTPDGRRGCFGRAPCGSWNLPSPLRRSR